MAQAMGLPGEDDLEFSRIERRRQLANMLAGDAMSPVQSQGTGMYASPISPFQGLQKMLAGYLAGRGMNKADEAQKQVVLDRQRRLQAAPGYLEQLRQPNVGEISQGQAPEPSSFQQTPVQGVAPLTRQQMDEVVGADYAGLRKPTPPVDLPGVFDLPQNVAGTIGLPMRQATLEDVGGVIRAPEVGVTGKSGVDGSGTPRVAAPETPEGYMAKVRIAAQKAGVTPQAFLEYAPDVKATYEQLVLDAKDKRDFLRQSDLESIKQKNAIALEAIQSGRVKNVQALEDGRVILIDGQGKQVGVIQGPEKFRTIESGAGTDAKGQPMTVDKRISFIDGNPTAVDIPGVQARSRAPLATVSNTVSTALEKSEKTEQGKANVKMTMEEIRPQAETARKMNAHIQTMTDVINRGDFKTGFAGPTRGAVNSFFAFMGSPEAAKRATDAQSFQSAALEVVLQKQLAQKGPQTESDAKRISDTGARLAGTPQANRYILALAKANNDRDIARYNFFRNWYSKNGGTYEGAESAWYGEGPGKGVPDAGRGGRSLFDEPSMSAYRSGRAEEGPKSGGGWSIEKVK